MNKYSVIFYLCFPLLAILACNAPIEQFQPPSATVVRPTIGAPPTLTPLAIQESEFVIVTAILAPSNTPTPIGSYTPAAKPTSTIPPPTPPNALPTVTLNPEFEATILLQDGTPESYLPIKLFTYYEWGIFDATEEPAPTIARTTESGETIGISYEETYQEFYKGRLVLVGRGGSDVFAYYVDAERISGAFYPVTIENCGEQSFLATVQSLNSEPLDQEVTVKAPCVAQP